VVVAVAQQLEQPQGLLAVLAVAAVTTALVERVLLAKVLLVVKDIQMVQITDLAVVVVVHLLLVNL
jgi:hypothetical protein